MSVLTGRCKYVDNIRNKVTEAENNKMDGDDENRPTTHRKLEHVP